MTATKNTFVLLRQVEGPRWCVVRHALRDGKTHFVDRLATARSYPAAAQIAIASADRMGLILAIQADGKRLRRFDPITDAPNVGGGR